mgnify:CR=1 FL=1
MNLEGFLPFWVKLTEAQRTLLRDTVRELYDEFREEELQQMSLKNQYSF